jgi:hypothetical protein
MYFHLCHLPTIPLTTLVCRSFYLNQWRWKMFYEKLIVAQLMYKFTDFKRTTIHTMLNHLNEVYILNHYWSIPELLFLKRQSSGTCNDRNRSERGVCFSYIDARKKVLERRSGLRPSEKELSEWRSGAFRYKNTPGLCYSLILSSCLHIRLSSSIFLQISRLKFCMYFSNLSCVLHVPVTSFCVTA